MIPLLRIGSAEAETLLREIDERRRASSEEALRFADEVIAGVRARGDDFVAEQIERFDGVRVAPAEILIAPQHSSGAPAASPASRLKGAGGGAPQAAAGDQALREAIDIAIERVESFHLAQKPAPYLWTRRDTNIAHRVRPLRRVGIYMPGGRAVYISTLIMCAVPARIAGVAEIVVATAPAAANRLEVQYVCARLGIGEVYRAGGAAGVAAMAIGTATLRRVDKIVGPGNMYVTAAKTRLFGQVGIDMTAGPTELIVIADDTADAEIVASDLLAQAEHGPDSAVICAITSETRAREIAAAWDRSGGTGGPLYLMIGTIDEAIELANRIAPEHVAIHARDAANVVARLENCGAIYCGRWSAPAAGDYLLGSNHVLPTAGAARFSSPLGVYDFVKRTNIVTAGRVDSEAVAGHVQAIAGFEQLPLHGRSVVRS